MITKLTSWIYSQIPIIKELRQIRDLLISINANTLNIKSFQAHTLLNFRLQEHERYGNPKRLHLYGFQVNSQNQEDGMIHEIFKRIGTTNRIFVEVGIGNGLENNTAFLLSQGWTGFWVDGNPNVLQILSSKPKIQSSLKIKIEFVGKENVQKIFESLEVPVEFDLLSIDIDQNTYYIWEELKSFRPRVVVIEYNAAIPADINWKVEYYPDKTWDSTQNFGASLKAFELLAKEQEYSLVGCDLLGVNAFFVRNDCLDSRFLEPYTSENHYEPPRYGMVHRVGHLPNILDKNIM